MRKATPKKRWNFLYGCGHDMNKRKVLMLTGALPYPLTTGAKIRTFNLLKRLADEFDIDLLTVITDESEKEYIAYIEAIGVSCHYLILPGQSGLFKKATDAFLSWILSEPYLTRHYRSKPYRKRLDKLLAATNYDVIHCDAISMTPNFQGLDKRRLILTQHNIEQVIWAGYVKRAGNPLMHVYYRNQHRKIERLESRLNDTYGHVVTVSANDKQILSQFYPDDRITVVENGVDPATYENDRPLGERSGIVFTGSLDWMPNIDGLTWFACDIYPLLRTTVPGLQIKVVGRRPSFRLMDILSTRTAVTVHADVPEIQPFLHEARVMIVPLHIGGGSRLKILEAMASRLPVVATAKGAEGLDVEHGKNILIANEPEKFAGALIDVLNDDSLHQRLAEAGLELINARYSWENVARPLADLWRSVAGE
jgi:glycosyltransferase involved in cell wall biosynthesis